MIKPIMKSEFFLRLPSEDAGPDDAVTGQDLLDTLHEHEHECVGLAANMIGVRKRIICVKDGNRTLLMYNPQILRAGQCLSDERRMPLADRRAPLYPLSPH